MPRSSTSGSIAGFKPGQSGNPSGRPKGLAKATRDRVDAAAVERGAETGADALVDFWIGIVFDTSVDVKTRLDASKLLADRGWGKVPAYMPVEADDPLELTEREIDAAAADFRAEVVRLTELEAARQRRAEGGKPARSKRGRASGETSS